MRKIDILKSMRTFVVVTEKGSFSDASRELNIVTSAVSKQISDLEAHFSTQLLYRTTRAMHLTSEGEFFLEQFEDIIARVDNLEDIASERQQKISGQLCISAPQGSASLGFLQTANKFIKRHPDVRISWLFLNRFVNMVEEGIDLSIRIGELSDSSLIARRYASVKVHFVASPEYIESHGQPLHPKELRNHQCILDSSNQMPGRWRFRENQLEQQVSVKAFVQANEGGLVARLAVEGHGIAYLPAFLMQPYLDSGRLVPILRNFEFEPSPVSLVFPANRLVNPTLRTFIDFLIESKP